MKNGRYHVLTGVVLTLVGVICLLLLMPISSNLGFEFIPWAPQTFASANALLEEDHPLLVAQNTPENTMVSGITRPSTVDLTCQVIDRFTRELIREPGHAEIKINGFTPYNVAFSDGKLTKSLPYGLDFAIAPIYVPGYWPIGGNQPVQMAREGIECSIALTSVSRPQPPDSGWNVVADGLPQVQNQSTSGRNLQIAYRSSAPASSPSQPNLQASDPRDSKIARALCYEGLKLVRVVSGYVPETIGTASSGVNVQTNILINPNAEPGDCTQTSPALSSVSRVFYGKQIVKVTATVRDARGLEFTKEFTFDTDCANRLIVSETPPVTPPPTPPPPPTTSQPPIEACLILEKRLTTGTNPNKWGFRVTIVGVSSNTYNLDSNSNIRLGVPRNSTVTVEETRQNGWQIDSITATGNSNPASVIGEVLTVVTRDDANCLTVTFTNKPIPQVSTLTTCVIVEKKDNNGNPLPNWTFKVSTPGQPGQLGTGFDFRVTDSNGQIRYNNFPLNSPVTVEEILQSGTTTSFWQLISISVNGNTVSTGSNVVSTTVQTGNDPNNCTQVRFVNQLITTSAVVTKTCLTIIKMNTNGVRLSGQNFRVTGASLSGQTYTTGSNGEITNIPNLTLGSQVVVEELVPSTTPAPTITSSTTGAVGVSGYTGSGYSGTTTTRNDGSCVLVTFVNPVTATATPTATATATPQPPTLRVDKQLVQHDMTNNRYLYRLYAVDGNCSSSKSFNWTGVDSTNGGEADLTVNAGQTRSGSAQVTCSNGAASTNWSVTGPSITDPGGVSINQNGGWNNNNNGTYTLNLIAETRGGGGCPPCTFTWTLQSGTGTLVPNGQLASITVAATGTVTVKVEVDFPIGANATDTETVTAPNAPPPTNFDVYGISSSGWTGSGNKSTTLIAQVTGGCSTKNYTWQVVSGNATLSSTSGQSITVTSSGGTVAVKVTVTTCSPEITDSYTWSGNAGDPNY